jgi:hypothetical protein
VIDFNSTTNEITLKLNSKYNAGTIKTAYTLFCVLNIKIMYLFDIFITPQVLKRANKFSVVFEEELERLEEMNEMVDDEQDENIVN